MTHLVCDSCACTSRVEVFVQRWRPADLGSKGFTPLGFCPARGLERWFSELVKSGVADSLRRPSARTRATIVLN